MCEFPFGASGSTDHVRNKLKFTYSKEAASENAHTNKRMTQRIFTNATLKSEDNTRAK